ncbi:Protein transport protein SFT2 [Golovinomyces cichoracearum]|uniref:Protein transport protein SFT2 n=1 Tax=Golovinomyces cichoracearum TaxID=62708 RepID=A0A420IJR5_9PEZI|nr:Protein transport protein SFT2 [Golovinomyces cichoracearum]
MMAKPRKFAILWSLGSALFLASWAAMMGPWAYATHLLCKARLPFTAAYFGSIILTLYFSLGHNLNHAVVSDTASMLSLVSDKLFPYGNIRIKASCEYWDAKGDYMDDWLKYISLGLEPDFVRKKSSDLNLLITAFFKLLAINVIHCYKISMDPSKEDSFLNVSCQKSIQKTGCKLDNTCSLIELITS